MPSMMSPLYGISVIGEPPINPSLGELEMALDDTPELRGAMERLVTPDVAPDPGLTMPGPAPTPALEPGITPTLAPFRR